MPDTVDPLILDLLEWIGPQPRPYQEVMEAWRTSCPRLPVWEEANARGYVSRTHSLGGVAKITVTAAGRAFLKAHRSAAPRPKARPARPGAPGSATA